jgi:hypothetical protein
MQIAGSIQSSDVWKSPLSQKINKKNQGVKDLQTRTPKLSSKSKELSHPITLEYILGLNIP